MLSVAGNLKPKAGKPEGPNHPKKTPEVSETPKVDKPQNPPAKIPPKPPPNPP